MKKVKLPWKSKDYKFKKQTGQAGLGKRNFTREGNYQNPLYRSQSQQAQDKEDLRDQYEQRKRISSEESQKRGTVVGLNDPEVKKKSMNKSDYDLPDITDEGKRPQKDMASGGGSTPTKQGQNDQKKKAKKKRMEKAGLSGNYAQWEKTNDAIQGTLGAYNKIQTELGNLRLGSNGNHKGSLSLSTRTGGAKGKSKGNSTIKKYH